MWDVRTRQNRLNDDLRWCVRSAPLIRGDDGGHIWPGTKWCGQLEVGCVSPLPMPRDLHQFRLGQHFEALLKAWVDNREDMHINQMNLQVREGRRTVGEFDFLIDKGPITEHWEAAIKFYLGTGDTRNMGGWYGPNTADRFDLKFERLVKLQLNLADHPAARKTLARLDIKVDRALCFMKGRLFYPWEQFHTQTFEFPANVNPDHEKGWWITLDRFESAAPRDYRYVPLRKIDWLSPMKAGHEPDSLSLQELLARLKQRETQQATHVAIVNHQGDEQSRGFVVSARWLARIHSDSRPQSSPNIP